MTITIDKKGRLVLPKKYRSSVGLLGGGSLEVAIQGNGILLKPKRHVSARQAYGVARLKKIKLEDIEAAAGPDALD